MDLSHQNFNCTLSTESLNHISTFVGEKLMVLSSDTVMLLYIKLNLVIEVV